MDIYGKCISNLHAEAMTENKLGTAVNLHWNCRQQSWILIWLNNNNLLPVEINS